MNRLPAGRDQPHVMDPLSFLILRRIASKIADWIDKLFDFLAIIITHPMTDAPEEPDEQMTCRQAALGSRVYAAAAQECVTSC